MTSKEWRNLLQSDDWDTASTRPIHLMTDIIDDLDAMEKLAIGGDGTTHYYYKDVVENLQSRLDEAVKAMDKYGRHALDCSGWSSPEDAQSGNDMVSDEDCNCGFSAAISKAKAGGGR